MIAHQDFDACFEEEEKISNKKKYPQNRLVGCKLINICRFI